MKEIILEVLGKYLNKFPDEKERQTKLIKYLEKYDNLQIVNYNNFEGHITASGFIYSLEEKKFLMIFHKKAQAYLNPGGHSDLEDKNPLVTAKREIMEETGVKDLKTINIVDNEIVPIDIDTHIIPFDAKKNLPAHYHFDFCYLFVVDKIKDIKIAEEEVQNYKLVNIDELYNNKHYGKRMFKIEEMIKNIEK